MTKIGQVGATSGIGRVIGSNIVIGSTLPALTTGAGNIAIGNEALNATTTGSKNVAIGLGALKSNTTGQENVAVGYNTLTASTIKSQNVAIGSQALKSNTTGEKNVAVGPNALADNTIGSKNVAIGTATMPVLVEGEFNVAIGAVAMNQNTTGNRNTVVGAEAMVETISAEKNVAIGFAALTEPKEAFYNTVVGVDALPGMNKVKLEKNTALGYKAGYECEGEANVFLGYEAGRKEKGSNKLYISNSETATPLILGDFSAKTLTIGGTLAGKELLGAEQIQKPPALPAKPAEGEVTVGAQAVPRKVVARLIGNGAKTGFSIEHKLKTRAVQVNLYTCTAEEPHEEVITFAGTIVITGTEKVEVKFTVHPAAGEEYAVVITG